MSNIRVEFDSTGGDALISDLQEVESGFKRTQQAVRALSAESRNLATLQRGFKITGEVAKLSKELGLTERQVTAATQRLQQLNAQGATTQQRFNALNKELGISAKEFLALDKAVNTYNQRVAQVAAAQQRASEAIKDTTNEVRDSGAVLRGFQERIGQIGVDALADSFQQLGSGINQFVEDAFNADRQLQDFTNSLTVATGSAQAGGEAMSFIRGEVDRLSLDLPTAIEGFTKLAAAARGTSLEGEGIQEVFTGMSQAASSLSLDADKTQRAFLALEQILSKGTLSAEEIRGQLGEALPGAFQIAARAMGVTTAELQDLLKQGAIASDEFLPRFAKQLQTEFAQSFDSPTKAINRLNTAVFDFRSTIGNELRPATVGFLTAATDLLNGFNELNPTIQRTILATGALGVAFGALVIAVSAFKILNR